MHTGARARKQKHISIYIYLYMKTFLKTGVYTTPLIDADEMKKKNVFQTTEKEDGGYPY